MSLVPSWVRAVNGKWYKNPVLRGEDYFICFDDDDPAEIVVEIRNRSNAEIDARIDEVIKDFGKRIKYCDVDRSHRCFDRKPSNYKPAAHTFFTLTRCINVPLEFDAVSDCERPKAPCVLYDPRDIYG